MSRLPFAAALCAATLATSGTAMAQADFNSCLAGIRATAAQQGVSGGTFDRVMAGVTPDPKVIESMNAQPEFKTPIWDYLATLVDEQKVAEGRQMMSRHAQALASAEQRFGVDRYTIAAVWGVESDYGKIAGRWMLPQSLATLACTANRRQAYFRGELIATLKIVDRGDIAPSKLRGSWAGAMGHTQFMPSSYMKYAVDQTGDGHADIWNSSSDAIASTANYLKSFGWVPGLPWGIEVVVPEGFDHNLYRASFASFRSAGLRRADGGSLPSSGEARLFYPAGHTGPALLLTANFDVIKKYNSSDAYALAVGHLGDRIVGRPALQGEWPVKAPRLDMKGVTDLQHRLKRLGLYSHDADGRIGTGTRDAVRQYQQRAGLLADGWPTPALLARMKAAR